MSNRYLFGRDLRSLPRFLALAAGLALPLQGCDLDTLLQVDDPDVAKPQSLEGQPALPALLAGAQSDFQVGFSGSSTVEGIVTMGALLADEFVWVETFPTREQVDRRSINEQNVSLLPIFRNLQRARAAADRASSGFGRFSPNTVGHATALNLAGYSLILLAEHYCSGVPLSTLTASGQTEFGAPQTSEQMYQAAIARFDSALAAAAGTGAAAVEQQRLARVGKARALLNLNQVAQAAAVVSGVPTTYASLVFHSDNSGRQNNGVFAFTWLGRRFSVSNARESAATEPWEPNALPYRTDRDPRVPFERRTGTLSVGFSGDPLFLEAKYPDRGTEVVLASGVEARLIEAEAALRAGQTDRFLSILNALRATPPTGYYPVARFPGITSLAPLTDPGNQVGRRELLFKERAYWMWLTGHRVGDLRRLVRQYGVPESVAFPSGQYYKGGVYGEDTNFPVPFEERQNDLFQGCLDRKA
ncbi:MAG TPA: hypothetical protein VGR37_23605 [Longimicrobiaceae bacterium]|nr:hypothetical protein [Longimicrobiaceae bacterium]